MSMTHGTPGAKGTEEVTPPPRPPSQQSSGSGSGTSKHVKCIGRYVLTGNTLGKGNFARVEAAIHTLTKAKVNHQTKSLLLIVFVSLFVSAYIQGCR